MARNDFSVYVVEDDESVLDSLKLLIESAGYQARGFASAEELIRFGCLQNAACLILDVRLPGMSGFGLIEHLNATGQTIPVVFITGHDRPGMKELAIKLGAVGYLPKPFLEQALLAAIETCCEHSGGMGLPAGGAAQARQ